MLRNEKLDNLLNNKNYKFYAHTRESSSEKELLSAHLKLTYKYYEKMEKEKSLDKKVKKLIKTIFKVDDKILIRKFLYRKGGFVLRCEDKEQPDILVPDLTDFQIIGKIYVDA